MCVTFGLAVKSRIFVKKMGLVYRGRTVGLTEGGWAGAWVMQFWD